MLTNLSDTKSNERAVRFYGLDHLRALAILLVLLFHYFILSNNFPTYLIDFAKFGWTGVDLFFVLSGFLISSQLFGQIKQAKIISFKNFFIKRFFRIFPAFAFTLAIYFLFPFFREKESLPSIWSFLTFIQNLSLDIQNFGTFSHAWSLCVEEHFYFFLPLLLIFLQKLKYFKYSFLILIFLFIFGFFIRDYNYYNYYMQNIELENAWKYWYQYIYYPTYTRLDGLIMGVSIAAIYTFLPKIWNKITQYPNFFIFLSLGSLGLAYYICLDTLSYQASIFGFPLVAFGYAFLTIAAISENSFLYKFKSKITSYLAMISYSLYLIHKGIIHITQIQLESYQLSPMFTLVLCFLACIIAASMIYFFIEKTFLKLRDKLFSI